MGLFDLVAPRVNGMSLPAALNALRRGEIPHPDAGDDLVGVMAQQDQLPPAPTAPRREWLDQMVAEEKAKARQQEAIDSYEINLRLRAREIQNG